MVDEMEAGNLRVVLTVGGNPMASFPQPARFAEACRRLDAVVTLDVIGNDMTDLATHVLPTAGQLERADLPLWLNLMQPVVYGQYTPAVLPLPRGRKPIWWYAGRLARALGHDVLPGGIDPGDATDDDILRPIVDASRSDFETLARRPTGHIADEQVFGWVHDALPGGRWRLAPPELVAQLDVDRQPAPLVLIPRRQVRHLNSGLSDIGSGGRRDEPDILLHPADAEARGIADGDPVVVSSGAGSVEGIAKVTAQIRQGAMSVPHGFSAPNVGHLISNDDHVDPLTGMVLQSSLPVEVHRAAASVS
jgi:anaerobic selenocysteine-containing dehydrogenase